MDSFIKRYFWIVNVAVLGVIAYLGARVANNLIAGEIVGLATSPAVEGPEKEGKNAKSNKKSERRGLGWAERIMGRNLFNANPPEDPEDGPKDPNDKPEEGDKPVVASGEMPTSLDACEKSEERIVLLATMVAEPQELSMAVVQDNSNDRILKPGMSAGEDAAVKVARINRSWLVLQNSKGTYECVAVGGKKQAKKKKGRGVDRTKPKKGNRGGSLTKADRDAIKNGVQKTGKNEYQIDREMLNEQLADLNKLARQARVIPHYRDGQAQGYKLVGVRPGSLYSHLGVRSGDILKGVNGEEVNSPNKALELFEKLKSSDNVSLEVERRGKPVALEYNIK
ncbi:MAG: type II secretion system protein GspC [Bradymonadia bacterium]